MRVCEGQLMGIRAAMLHPFSRGWRRITLEQGHSTYTIGFTAVGTLIRIFYYIC